MLKQSQCGCDGQKRYHTLTVQSPAGTTGTDGHIDYTSDANWTTEGTIKGYFTSKAGREFVQGKRLQADHSQMIETVSTNFSRSIETSWRLVFGTRNFEILSAVDVNEERRMVQLEVKERK